MRKTLVILSLLTIFIVTSCDDSQTPLQSIDTGTGLTGKGLGFGVSGLLFENNLVMWYRENEGESSELFPQMYFTRADANHFPVWDSFPFDLLVSGGVPRDGIPALVDPEFVSSDSAELSYLAEEDLVLGVYRNGVAKAYPQNILWWHEIVNDEIAGENIIVTLCPLTGTGMVFALPDAGSDFSKLDLQPVVETTWKNWKALYPETVAISENTGFDRSYTTYPYTTYREEDSFPLFPLQTGDLDSRYPPKHTILGLFIGAIEKAYPFSELPEKGVVNDVIISDYIVIVSDIEARYAVPFDRRVDGDILTFEYVDTENFQMKDMETESIWNSRGEAISGPLEGKQLIQLPAYNAFWFAWAIFWPDSRVYQN